MGRPLRYISGLAFFVAGAATAAMASRRRGQASNADTEELKRAVERLEARLQAQETATEERLSRVESTVAAQAAKLSEIPSTAQIVAAMEQLLTKTMSSLDDRLSNQANAIDVLKTTVSQTDGLLERVLDNLDVLQTTIDSTEPAEQTLSSGH